MTNHQFLAIFGIALITTFASYESNAEESAPEGMVIKEARVATHKVERDYVPNGETAIRIAVAVWEPIYGAEQINKEKPFIAKLKNGVWQVTGSLPERTKGGVAIAEINMKDGKILRISHGQ